MISLNGAIHANLRLNVAPVVLVVLAVLVLQVDPVRLGLHVLHLLLRLAVLNPGVHVVFQITHKNI